MIAASSPCARTMPVVLELVGMTTVAMSAEEMIAPRRNHRSEAQAASGMTAHSRYQAWAKGRTTMVAMEMPSAPMGWMRPLSAARSQRMMNAAAISWARRTHDVEDRLGVVAEPGADTGAPGADGQQRGHGHPGADDVAGGQRARPTRTPQPGAHADPDDHDDCDDAHQRR